MECNLGFKAWRYRTAIQNMIQRTSHLRGAWKNSVTFQRVRGGQEPGCDSGAERNKCTHSGLPRRSSGSPPWLQQTLNTEKGRGGWVARGVGPREAGKFKRHLCGNWEWSGAQERRQDWKLTEKSPEKKKREKERGFREKGSGPPPELRKILMLTKEEEEYESVKQEKSWEPKKRNTK